MRDIVTIGGSEGRVEIDGTIINLDSWEICVKQKRRRRHVRKPKRWSGAMAAADAHLRAIVGLPWQWKDKGAKKRGSL